MHYAQLMKLYGGAFFVLKSNRFASEVSYGSMEIPST